MHWLKLKGKREAGIKEALSYWPQHLVFKFCELAMVDENCALGRGKKKPLLFAENPLDS